MIGVSCSYEPAGRSSCEWSVCHLTLTKMKTEIIFTSFKTKFGRNIVIYDTLIYFIYFIYMTLLENGKDHFRSIGSYNLRLALVLPVLVLEAEPKLAAAPNVSSGGVSY